MERLATLPQQLIHSLRNPSVSNRTELAHATSVKSHLNKQGELPVKLLKNPLTARTDSEFERRVVQLVVIAQALASEIDALRSELSGDRIANRAKEFDLGRSGIDFYKEIARYEIDLIMSAVKQCSGNQARAARLLGLKSTTLHAKMKHYGLNAARQSRISTKNN